MREHYRGPREVSGEWTHSLVALTFMNWITPGENEEFSSSLTDDQVNSLMQIIDMNFKEIKAWGKPYCRANKDWWRELIVFFPELNPTLLSRFSSYLSMEGLVKLSNPAYRIEICLENTDHMKPREALNDIVRAVYGRVFFEAAHRAAKGLGIRRLAELDRDALWSARKWPVAEEREEVFSQTLKFQPSDSKKHYEILFLPPDDPLNLIEGRMMGNCMSVGSVITGAEESACYSILARQSPQAAMLVIRQANKEHVADSFCCVLPYPEAGLAPQGERAEETSSQGTPKRAFIVNAVTFNLGITAQAVAEGLGQFFQGFEGFEVFYGRPPINSRTYTPHVDDVAYDFNEVGNRYFADLLKPHRLNAPSNSIDFADFETSNKVMSWGQDESEVKEASF